ncbi:MAG: AsmA family protein, partial [Candidatus Poribacteria bacterium]|nr:AsmA family protein [Candidatus Poribacteria bacterium]
KGDLELTDLSVKVSQNQNEPSLPQYKDVPIGNIKASLNVNGELVKGKVPKLDANIKTKLALNNFKEFTPQLKRLDGIVDVNITAKGEMRDISSICKIDSKSLYVNDLKINNLKGNVKLSQKGVLLSDISANLGDGKAGIKGSAKLTGGKLYGYKGDVRLSNLDTYNILSGLTSTKSPLSGILNGKILINGKELRPGAFQSKGDLELTDLSVKVSQNQNEPSLPQYKDVPIGNIKASLNVNGKSIAVNMSRDKTIMDVKGTLRDDAGLKLTMVLSGVDIAEMMSITTGSPSINGQGQIFADASMKIANPAFLASMGLKDGGQRGKIIKDIADLKGNVKINVPNLDIPIKNNEGQPSQVRIGSINGNLALDDDHVRTEDFALLLDNAKCLVKADVKIEKSPLVNARFTLDSLLIEKYAKLFGSNMPIHGGLINGEIGVSGKVTELNGSGEILVSDLSVGTRSIDPIIIPITIQSNVLKIPELIISSVGEQIKTACEFRPSGDYTLKIDSSPIDVAKLYKDVKSTPNDGVIISSEKAVTPGGKLQISLSGMGNFKFPYLDNKIKFDEIRYNGESFGNGECLINVGDKKVSLDMYSQDRILVANVDASIQKPFPFTIQLQLRDTDIKPVLKLAKIGDNVNNTRITGDINAHGDGTKPIDLSMDGTLQNMILNTIQNKWVSKSPINFNLADRKFKLDSMQMDSESESISLNAKADLIDYQKESKIELEVNANIKDFNYPVLYKKIYLAFFPHRPVENYHVLGVTIVTHLNLWVFR